MPGSLLGVCRFLNQGLLPTGTILISNNHADFQSSCPFYPALVKMSADAVEDSLITQFARNLQRTQVAQELVDIGVNLPRGLKAGGAPRVPDTAFDDHLIELKHRPKHLKVGIIGAGMAGLYTAYILDTLNIPRISYEILEAAGRPGGRCLTHRFSEDLWDYYDVGAMRFPHNHTMDRYRHNPDSIVARIFQADLIRIYRFFKFAEDLGVELIPYYLQGENTPTRYNGKLFSGPVDWKSDPFGIQKTTKEYFFPFLFLDDN